MESKNKNPRAKNWKRHYLGSKKPLVLNNMSNLIKIFKNNDKKKLNQT
jgi:hypothetical protein